MLPAESQRPFMCSVPCTGTTGLGTASLKASVSVFLGLPKHGSTSENTAKEEKTELFLTEGLPFCCDFLLPQYILQDLELL